MKRYKNLGLVLRKWWSVAAVLAFVCVVASGLLTRFGQSLPAKIGAIVGLLGILGFLLLQVLFRLGAFPSFQRPKLLTEVEPGVALTLGTFALLQVLGDAHSPLHPLVYALAAFVTTYHRGRVALGLFGLIVLLEIALIYGSKGQPFGADLPRLLLRIGFLVVFAGLHRLFLRFEVVYRQRRHQREVEKALLTLHKEACEFRLQAAYDGERKEVERAAELLAHGSVMVIHQSLQATMDLLHRSLHLHTCALYWMNSQGDLSLRKESLSKVPLRKELRREMGALGMIVKGQTSLHLPQPKPGHLAYYEEPGVPVGAFLGVPILRKISAPDGEVGKLLAVLIADRLRGEELRPFTVADEAILASAADQIERNLQSEQLFMAVARSRDEQKRLYRASETLNRALTPEQVHRTAFSAVSEICDSDFVAITLYDRVQRMHQVVAIQGEEALGPPGVPLVGLGFEDNAGLVAMAVKNRAALPAVGSLRDRNVPVFDEHARLRGMESLLVLPLTCAGEVIGTLVLAKGMPYFFDKDRREMLRVLANQVAVSLENARMYQAMEAMATTDGLTGLTNRRSFNERFAEMLRRAERQGQPLTLLLTDIDHFKKVNDTYGHPMGDAVLKRVAQVVQSCMRKIDMAARYGGEEFAMVLETTDRQGGRQLAERIRQEVQKVVFHSDKGVFQCTLSLGMATFPQDANDVASLIAYADQALYHAKHNGRNQAVAYMDLLQTRRAAVG